jgi:hypothetical protein
MHQHRLSKVAPKRNSFIETATQDKSTFWSSLARAFGHCDLGQPSVKLVGWMALLIGSMILAGEYLCVEVAWRCFDYNQFRTVLGALLLGSGGIAVMIGKNYD